MNSSIVLFHIILFELTFEEFFCIASSVCTFVQYLPVRSNITFQPNMAPTKEKARKPSKKYDKR